VDLAALDVARRHPTSSFESAGSGLLQTKRGPSGTARTDPTAFPGQNAGRLNLADDQEIDMRTIDFTPLYRSAVGFDRLARQLESAARTSQDSGWPPYNIETTGENEYRIEIAVAGFKPDELTIEAKENQLTVTGRKTANDDAASQKTYLHRGLAERDFERRFQLADYVVVVGAALDNGLLAVSLKRELPEALKPRRIEIATTSAKGLIEGEAA
jgi:molecular chaperone IbpA